MRKLRKAEEEGAPQTASPEQVIDLLQELRNEVEMSGDLEKAAMYTNAIALVLQAEGAEEAVIAEPVEEAEEEHEELGEESPLDIEENDDGEEDADEEGRKLQMAARPGKLRKALTVSWVTPGELHKALGGQAQELAKLGKVLTSIDARLQKIEKQPAIGGPVLRPVSKAIAGQPGLTDKEREEKQARLADIRKAEAVESNPMVRAQYTRDKMRLEDELSRR